MNPLKTGDRVWVERIKDHGRIQSFSRDGLRVVVTVGQVSLNVPVSGLAEPRKVRAGRREEPAPVRRPARAKTVLREIDMHGLRVEEMLARLDQFLDDALLAGVPEVRVVHGHGSGALKKAVHRRLRELGVRHFRLGEPGQTPGGDGVTIVSL